MALSLDDCTKCNGTGVRLAGRGKSETFSNARTQKTEAVCTRCDRGVFRATLAAYKFHSESIGMSIRTNLSQFSRSLSRQGRRANGRRSEEFVADVLAVSKRNLTPRQWRIFSGHCIAGKEWNQFGIELGVFWHDKYRLEAKLGRIFRELKPYALYPTDEYF